MPQSCSPGVALSSLTVLHGNPFPRQHGQVLGRLLRVAGIEVEGFTRSLRQAPNFELHTQLQVRGWLDGDRLPGSPIPLLLALEQAVREAPDLTLADLLRKV